MFRGKKYKESAKQIDKTMLYDAADGMALICKTASAKFDETVELHVKLGVDSRHADQQVRGAIVLPHGTGKTVRVLVFAKGDKADAAREAGADYVGEMDMVEKIQKENWFDFDVVVASPDMMGLVGRLGKVLGPKGLMPSPKAGTVTPDVAKAVQEVKAGKIEYRLDKTNIIHCPIGKVSFGPEKLTENYQRADGRHREGEARRRQGPVYPQLCRRVHHGPRREDEHGEDDLRLFGGELALLRTPHRRVKTNCASSVSACGETGYRSVCFSFSDKSWAFVGARRGHWRAHPGARDDEFSPHTCCGKMIRFSSSAAGGRTGKNRRFFRAFFPVLWDTGEICYLVLDKSSRIKYNTRCVPKTAGGVSP